MTDKKTQCHSCKFHFWGKQHKYKCPKCLHITKPHHALVNWGLIVFGFGVLAVSIYYKGRF
jgi:hypothetical protein